MRKPWTQAELDDLSLGWTAFSAKHPTRSYDSWEVKRRRVPGGSGGTGVGTRADRVLAMRAAQALVTLAEFVEAKA